MTQIKLDTASLSIQRSEDFWYEDGNIVLIAQEVAFKVHRSILSRSSEVFRDMFAAAHPDPPEPFSILTECPVVHLSDTADEIKIFLDIMYDQGDE